MVRVIIAGSRGFTDYERLEKEVKSFLKGYRPSEIEVVSGHHWEGADVLGEQFAKKHKIKLKELPAQWTKFPKGAAGPIRNKEMAVCASEVPDGKCIVFWDGISTGSQSMMKYAREYGLDLKVIRVQ